ncbi:KR domain-containing protein [Haematospirillum sp. 15-248]|uniref:beta-ketoacyl synthase N-terminal-like domain-containing protein n=1 Tax=Haematospirillum sp. 15-248 TaxID=2723107 RepID=UPI00143BDFBF|nr:beta-ketoacyl synthase N-terminal-like domain-containing protein [Haematospirillum sp. 15-248]NKD88682.1 KR domain-containing protein [Haematospirillum sp. 15-248]
MSRPVSDCPEKTLRDRDYGSCQPVAVIGAACRFQDSPTPVAYWRNLADGRLLSRILTEEELDQAGIPESIRQNPDFVPMASVVPRVAHFDAAFFGFSPQEAESIDPQQRLFLTLAWEALDSAGYAGQARGMNIGVFGATRMGTYRLWTRADTVGIGAPRTLQALIGNDKDYLASRVAYRLGLTGPAVTVQTACSSSLVAVHTACEQIRNGECAMALAGGVALTFPQESGYLFHEGMIFSPDGRCRPYDANAQGTSIGNGAGVVLLKLLDDAVADGDPVLAVIRGSAVNNDGAAKTGYTAPSVDGQVAVIREALGMAEVDAGSITLLEGHGTATPLGDPIEVEALTTAFRADTDARSFCALGSVKANLGHCDTAAGIASLLKAVMALHYRQIPPVPGYEAPNPHIDFAASPFHVPVTLAPWEKKGNCPRRAGVSSFGIGGTNCHIVLEEAPEPVAGSPVVSFPTGVPVLVLSATGPDALRHTAARWADDLSDLQENRLPALLRTAAARPVLPWRLSLSAPDVIGLAENLDHVAAGDTVPGMTLLHQQPESIAQVILLFAGDPAQCLSHGRSLYESNATFRRAFDSLASLLSAGHAGSDLLSVAGHADVATLLVTGVAVHIALAEVWLGAGLKPDQIIACGPSALAAAAVAGVLSHEDALSLAALWARQQAASPDSALQPIHVLPEAVPFRLIVGETLVSANADRMQETLLANMQVPLRLPDLSSGAGVRAIVSVGIVESRVTDKDLWLESCLPDVPANLSVGAALGMALQAGLGVPPEAVTGEGEGKVWLTPRALQEQPFWSPEPPLATLSDHDEDGTGWSAALSAARAEAMRADLDITTLQQDEHYAEVLHAVYVGQALQALGCFENPDQQRTVADILRTTAIKPKFRQLVARLLRDLAAIGVLRKEGKIYTGFTPLPPDQILPALEALRQRGDERLAAVIKRGGTAFADMLSGRVDPVSVIFPDGSSDDVAAMYRHSAQSRLLNAIVAKAVAALAVKRTAPLSILEIGAGTGGTTWDVVHALPADRVERYIFTDLGSLFLSRARTTFAAFPFMDYRSFDMEKDPHDQGIPAQSLDLVIAANVLHNASDLDALMKRLAGCLRPGGVVIMREITQHRKLFDFVFGPLVPNLDDIDSRDGNVFASVERWRAAALSAGFAVLDAVPDGNVLADALHEHVLLCRMSGQPAVLSHTPAIPDPGEMPRTVSTGDLIEILWDTAEQAGLPTLAMEDISLDLHALPCPVQGYVSGKEIILLSCCGTNRVGYARVGTAGTIHIPEHGQSRDLSGRMADMICPGVVDGRIHIQRLQRRPGSVVRTLDHDGYGVGLDTAACPVLEWFGLHHDDRPRTEGYLYRLRPVSMQHLDHSGSLPDLLLCVGPADGLSGLDQAPVMVPCPVSDDDPFAGLAASVLALRDHVVSAQKGNGEVAVTLLTRGALSVTSTDAVSGDSMQAALTGLLRVMATEYPSVTLTLVDRDPAGDDIALLNQALRSCRGGHFALREGRVLAEKLEPVAAAIPPLQPVSGDVAVLIGGISETGLTIAGRLEQRGYKDIILVGRNKPGSGLAPALRALRESGIRVTTAVADAGHHEALSKALDRAVPEGRQIGILLHLAGVLHDSPVAALTWDILEKVLHPKVRGALALGKLPRRLIPRQTVYFSSAATVLGPAGQAAHAMANSILERLAYRQTALGQPTTAISWGFWGDIRKEDREALAQTMERSGMLGMSSAMALDLLESALACPAPVYVAMAADWNKVANHAESSRVPAHLSALVSSHVTAPVPDGTTKPDVIASEKTDALMWLRQRLSTLLNLPLERFSEDESLIRLGLDSLMFLDLCHTIQTELGIKVTPEAAIDHPTVAGLAGHMERLLQVHNGGTVERAPVPDMEQVP